MSAIDEGAIRVGRRVFCWLDSREPIKAGDLVRYVDEGTRFRLVSEVRGSRIRVKCHKHEQRTHRWIERRQVTAAYRWRKEMAKGARPFACLAFVACMLLACVAEVVEPEPAAEGGGAGAPPCAAGSHMCEPDRPVALVCDEGYTPPGDCISRLTAHCCAGAP